VIIPGQTVTIPLVVTNTGNIRDDFAIQPQIPGPLNYTFYRDLNRDGSRQADEPIINHVGPLAPHEAASVLLEVRSPRTEPNGATAQLALSLVSESSPTKKAEATLRLVYARPVLALAMAGKGGKLKPGEVASVELTCTNSGSSMARIVELRSILPGQMELVAADPAASEARGGDFAWRFEELGAGEKRTIKVTFRVKTGTAVGTSVQLKNVVSYEDLLGNRY
jgi:hypothetical protein